MSRFLGFMAELSRRKVVRLLFAYVAVFWLLAQGFASLFPVLGVPAWFLRAFIVTGTAAIPVLALLSWKYDLIPPQLVRDTRDSAAANPRLSWARLRHDGAAVGHIVLRWHAPDGVPKEKVFFGPLSIGRDPSNDIELKDQCVSRYHAVLWAEGGSWRVRDLDSTNGTFIDHARVTGTAILPRVCELRFHLDGPAVRVSVDEATETVVHTQA